MKKPVKQTVDYDDGTQDVLLYTPPLEGIHAYALHDPDCDVFFRRRNAQGKWGYNVPRMLTSDTDRLSNWDGFPEMVPFNPREGVRMTEQIQWWWMAQLVWSKYRIDIFEKDLFSGRVFTVKEQFHLRLTRVQQDYMKEAWRQLTRDDTAFMNGSGTNAKGDPTGKCYINNTGGSSLPRLWENGCGGSTYKVAYQQVLPEMTVIKLRTLKPSEHHIWKTWKFDDPLHRCYFTYAVNSTPFLVGTRDTYTETGPWKVDPMHMLGGTHVPVPLMNDNGIVYVDRNRADVIYDMREYRNPYETKRR